MRRWIVLRAGFEPALPDYGIGDIADHLSSNPHASGAVVPGKHGPASFQPDGRRVRVTTRTA
jgi:hypothetical protein